MKYMSESYEENVQLVADVLNEFAKKNSIQLEFTGHAEPACDGCGVIYIDWEGAPDEMAEGEPINQLCTLGSIDEVRGCNGMDDETHVRWIADAGFGSGNACGGLIDNNEWGGIINNEDDLLKCMLYLEANKI